MQGYPWVQAAPVGPGQSMFHVGAHGQEQTEPQAPDFGHGQAPARPNTVYLSAQFC